MESLLWSLYDRLILFLAGLNPATKERVEVLQNKAAALEAERAILLREIADGEKLNQGFRQQRQLIQAESAQLEAANKEAELLLEKRKANRAGLSDADKLELDV